MKKPDVLCLGTITPARVLVVDSLPQWNTGAVWTQGAEFVSDDAAIVAGLLAGWGVSTELAGSALGDDDAGQRTARMLRDMGVAGIFRLRSDIETPFEINISDASGGRTYYWNRAPETLATLEEADLSSLEGARLMYADWYDAPYNLRAMEMAKGLGVPVMLNLEHGHADSDALATMLPKSTIAQAVTNASQSGGDAAAVVELLLRSGASTALVTLAAGGVIGARGDEMIHVSAPKLRALDTCGAGATFSAAYIAKWLEEADFEPALRFAVAAASLKCTVVGPVGFPHDRIASLAESLQARRLA